MKSQKYKLFQEMMEGFKTNNTALFSHGAKCLTEIEEGNPFPENSEAKDHFHRMKVYYEACRRGDINQRANLRMVFDEAKALCALEPAQPYEEEILEEKQEPAQEMQAEVSEAESEASKEADKPAEENEHETIFKTAEHPVVFGALEESVIKHKRKPFLKR